ncbi:unnamed protein product [Danaus chrysippus]|uniref:(African queen) hypothetical protein n=1 Tax=Danaus chrysippus TaxID=151541 RepID=A0A8J2RAD2_9NEOP|nr:unnamed protein product [Danaus chrysippus]
MSQSTGEQEVGIVSSLERSRQKAKKLKKDISIIERVHVAGKKIKVLVDKKKKKSTELSKYRLTVGKLRQQIKDEIKGLVKIRQSSEFKQISGLAFRKTYEYIDHIMYDYCGEFCNNYDDSSSTNNNNDSNTDENSCDAPPRITSTSYHFEKMYKSTMECVVCLSEIGDHVRRELPPGWYYCKEVDDFAYDFTEFDGAVQKSICDHWRKTDIEDFHAAINLCVFWRPSCSVPVYEDDNENIYMNKHLMHFHLSQIFNRFENRTLPWLQYSKILCEIRNFTTTKYMKVASVDYKLPQWLRLLNLPPKCR